MATKNKFAIPEIIWVIDISINLRILEISEISMWLKDAKKQVILRNYSMIYNSSLIPLNYIISIYFYCFHFILSISIFIYPFFLIIYYRPFDLSILFMHITINIFLFLTTTFFIIFMLLYLFLSNRQYEKIHLLNFKGNESNSIYSK